MKYNTALPFFSKDDIDEIIPQLEEILKGNGFFTKGPKVKEFEKLFSEYIGSKYGVAVNSCTSALEIVLKAIGISDGDEVIVPTQTFVSTASCVVNNGGTPIFCEIEGHTSDKMVRHGIDELWRFRNADESQGRVLCGGAVLAGGL